MNTSFEGLHYYTSGNPKGTPLLLLHGFMGSASDWDSIIPKLHHKFYCISIDLPGHGQSINLNQIGDVWEFDFLSQRISSLLKSLKIPATIIVGYSFGGRVALNFSVRYPNTVSTLVLESASPGLKNPQERMARAKTDQIRANQLEQGPLSQFLENWYALPLFGDIKNHSKYPALLKKRIKNDPTLLALAIKSFSPGRQPGLWDNLPTLDMPVHLICGEKDTKYVGLMYTIKKNNPHFSLEIFKGCGHNIHFEKPVQFAEHLLDVLS